MASLSRISIPINFQSVSPSSIKPSTPTILTGIIEPVACKVVPISQTSNGSLSPVVFVSSST